MEYFISIGLFVLTILVLVILYKQVKTQKMLSNENSYKSMEQLQSLLQSQNQTITNISQQAIDSVKNDEKNS